MALIDTMALVNLMHDDCSSVDIGGNWIDDDQCHIAFRFNEDGQDDIEFHMLFARENLLALKDFIETKINEQNITLN